MVGSTTRFHGNPSLLSNFPLLSLLFSVPHSELFSFSLYLVFLLPLTFLLCNSVTISLVFLSFSLCFSFGYPFHLFVGLSMCLYLSIFLFSPLPKFLSHPRLPYPLSLLLLFPSRSSITRVSILLPLSPFSFCLSLSPPTVQSVFCYGRKLFIVNTRDPDSRPWNQLFSQGWIPITSIYTYPFYFFFSRDDNDFRDDLLGLEAFVRDILIKRFDLCLWLHQNTFYILDKQKSDFFSPIITGLLDLFFFFFSTMKRGRSKWILSSCLNACEMCSSNSRFFPTWYNCTFLILSQVLPFNLFQR